MEQQEKKHFSQKLWEYTDSQITSNILNVSTYFTNDSYNFSYVKLQFNIVNRKANIHTNFSLTHQYVVWYLAQFTPIYNKLDGIKTKIDETNGAVSFKINDFRKLVTTVLNRVECGGLCFRLAIGENDRDISEADVIYVPYLDYISLIKVLTNFRDSYCQIVSNVSNVIMLDQLNNNIDKLNTKLTDYYIHHITEKTSSSTDVETTHEPKNKENEIEIDLSIDNNNKEKPKDSLQGDLDNFIDEKIDTFDLGIDRNSITVNVEQASIIKKEFTKEFLKNDILNLEMYLFNCVNDVLPFKKLCDSITEKIGNSLVKASNSEMCGILYGTTIYLKENLNKHLNLKVPLPSSVPAIIYDCQEPSPTSLEVMYDLYLYLVYYSQLKTFLKEKEKNTVANKELLSFILKTLAYPLIFSYIKKIPKNLLIAEVVKRYHMYLSQKVFENSDKKIFETYGVIPTISPLVINAEVSRVYDLFIQNYDKFLVEAILKKLKETKLVSIDYEFFKKYNLTSEQMLKIISLELNFKKNKKVNFEELNASFGLKDFSDIPKDIISIFNIVDEKFDNTNLIRYVNQTFKDDKNVNTYIEICKLVNKSYYDLKGKNVDLSVLPEQVLKAIWLWDLEKDKKISLNYNYYIETINGSQLDKSMILSLLMNLSEKKDSDFVESLIAATETGA